ncbi:cysteine peptidase family C39 domain-containing protein [Kordia sp.]|uniref:cysteine peptidase family C39 domain-containing protein n=1 Tax=Kordia sp. TaxID=1965332 RepID=UPI003D6B189C
MDIIKILWYIFFVLFSTGEEKLATQKESFPIILQKDQVECGPTCLQMISKHYGTDYGIETLNKLANLRAEGTSLGDIADAAETIGFKTLAVEIDYDTFFEEVPYPAMVHWRNRHFAVVYNMSKDSVWVADPAIGLLTYSKKQFLAGWAMSDVNKAKPKENGYALLFETTTKFYNATTKPSAIAIANKKK